MSDLEQTSLAVRSPLLMNRENSAMLIVDVQKKLVPLISRHEAMVFNICRLLDGAQEMGVRVDATEQYPKGLGNTVDEIASKLDRPVPEKTMFSCRECQTIVDDLHKNQIVNVVLVGIETHVCIAQTALDFLANGFHVFVCVDAIGARHSIDHTTALRRLEYAGVTPTTTEAVLFEWCGNSKGQRF